MTNKYERAAKFLAESGSAELRTYGELLDTQAGYELLRAAAKLPATVDAVKVLKMYAAGELVERPACQHLSTYTTDDGCGSHIVLCQACGETL